MVTWTAAGALAGLLLSLALKCMLKRSPDTSGNPDEARGFFRRYAPGMALAGILAGTIAGILQSNLEKPVFESTAVFQPARMDIPPAGVTHREWLNTEAAAMASQKNLEQVALRLNLPHEWQCPMEECVARLKSQLEIAAVPDTELIRIVAHGPSAGECASVANAAIAAREDQTVTAARPEVIARISERAAKLTALEKSAGNKRSELVTGIQAMNILVNTHSDAAINALTLPQLLSDARTEWHDELARVETAKTELAASGASTGSRQPYAKILESAVPSVNPVEREWIPCAVAWSAAGAGIALALCLLLAIEEHRSTPQHKERKPPLRPPLLAGDY